MSEPGAEHEPAVRAAVAPLLSVSGLTAGYGGRPVVYDVSLNVGRGEAVVVFGSNGAGKTTTLKSIVGLVRPLAASISYAGEIWRTDRPWRAAKVGIAFIPSERFVFAGLTVAANLSLGGYATASVSDRQERLDFVLEMFPILAQRRTQKAGTLSGGQQRMLSLAVALMSRPRLLLLDEPSLGLAPMVVEQIMQTIHQLIEQHDMSVLMVEQNIGQALEIAHRTYVMRSGRIILEEPAEATRARDEWWDLF